MKLVIDASSIMWTSLLVGKDPEGFSVLMDNGKDFHVNKAPYGYECAVNMIVAALGELNLAPKDIVFVYEGMSSKQTRLMIDKEYKATRGKRPAESYLEFGKLKEMLQDTFFKLGSIAVSQDFVEGDDVLGWIAQNTEEDITIMSNDNDMYALCTEGGVNKYGAKVDVRINGVINYNKLCIPADTYVVYKSLIGDSSDNIKGTPGFGPKAWEAFMQTYGDAGLYELKKCVAAKSFKDLESEIDNKSVRLIIEKEDDFRKSYNLATIHTEWVNTLRWPLNWTPGMVSGTITDERLTRWKAQQRLVTAATWDAFVKWATPLIALSDSLGLDIETSTGDESDAWLEAQGNAPGEGLDTIGSTLTGMSLTFGDNDQYTVYLPVDHVDTDNVDIEKLREFIMSRSKQLIIHNTAFEGPVLWNTWGDKHLDNGYEGFLPDWLDTKMQASYVDENESLGLKNLASRWFGYDQVDYKTVTTIDGVQYKMNQLTGKHVQSYACDDTIVTKAFHNFSKLFMQLEHTWEVYKQVEIDSSYLHAQSFTHGTKFDIGRLSKIAEGDAEVYAGAWKDVSTFLISKGWDGSVAPVYTGDLTAAQVKEAYLLIHGEKFETQVRTLSKLADSIADPLLAGLVRDNNAEGLTKLVASRFTAAPEFNIGSPKQLAKLLYEVMELPIKLRNPATDTMKKAGILEGNPKTDVVAIEYAKVGASEETIAVLKALVLMKMVKTRQGLYYEPYPYFVHWKTGRVHSSHNQCGTVTRRASSSKPNLQQLSATEKVEGYAPEIRQVIIPHKRNAVIVSMDFKAQELRLFAEQSQDENLLACYVGDDLKDVHGLTGYQIWNSERGVNFSYEEFMAVYEDENHSDQAQAEDTRKRGKTVNFAEAFGAKALKIAITLLVEEAVAQMYLDAKAAAFPRMAEWKLEVVEELKHTGVVYTLMGAVRHLQKALSSDDGYERSKADRQGVNMMIQGSAAEQTKLAEGRMWRERLEQRFDCEVIAPVHDEVVFSCVIDDLEEFIPVAHACMVAQYANMQVPTESSIAIGPNMGQQIEIGSKPTVEAIRKGLVRMKEKFGV